MDLAAGGELLGDVAQLLVGGLADLYQQCESLVGGDPVAFHQDAFRLPDEVAGVDGREQAFVALRIGQGHRGVAGEEPSDVYGILVERTGFIAVEVERAEILTPVNSTAGRTVDLMVFSDNPDAQRRLAGRQGVRRSPAPTRAACAPPWAVACGTGARGTEAVWSPSTTCGAPATHGNGDLLPAAAAQHPRFR